MRTRSYPNVKLCAHLGSAGFTLIEVMVGLALSMLSMLVIVQLFSMSDARKRATTGAAEAQQTANVSLYQVMRTVRLAGAGLAQANNVWGCPIQAFRGSSATQILPPTAAFAAAPSAFVNVYTLYPTVRAIPLLILPAAAPDTISDVIVVIAGNGETGQAELQILGQPVVSSLAVQRLNGVKALDMILVTVPSTIANCVIGQVDSTLNATSSPNTLPLGGTGANYTATGLASFNTAAVPLHLGATPMFTMFGIDSNNALSQFDLLNLTGTATSIVADNVVDMRARYGVVAANGSGPITWQAPNAAPWDVASLTAGTTTARDLIDRIRAIRIAIVFRGTEPVRDDSPPTSYVMFPDASPITVSISAANQPYRYQVYDTIIPLRNIDYVPLCSTTNALPRC